MVRETRYLWVANLPNNVKEDRLKDYFRRFGRVQNVKLQKEGDVTAATVAFMDIKSAAKARYSDHNLEDKVLRLDYWEPGGPPPFSMRPNSEGSRSPSRTPSPRRSRSRSSGHGSPRARRSRSSSASSRGSKSPRVQRNKLKNSVGLGPPLGGSSEYTPLAMCVKNLPLRSSDTSLKDGLFHEYKKHGKVTCVKVAGQGPDRFAVVTFKKSEDLEKALEVSKDKMFFGSKIEVSRHEGAVDVEDNEFRPLEAELDEYHPKATRTLFVGNLEREISLTELRTTFVKFGEIIDVDVKKQGINTVYAFIQFPDITSVVKAMREMDGEHLGANRIKLGFGKSMPAPVMWIDGIGESVPEKYLTRQMARFGPILYTVLDRRKGHAMIFFEQTKSAVAAVQEMRGRSLGGRRLQVDFASKECQLYFLDNLDPSCIDTPWEREIRELIGRPPPSRWNNATAHSSDRRSRGSTRGRTATRSVDEFSQCSSGSREDLREGLDDPPSPFNSPRRYKLEQQKTRRNRSSESQGSDSERRRRPRSDSVESIRLSSRARTASGSRGTDKIQLSHLTEAEPTVSSDSESECPTKKSKLSSSDSGVSDVSVGDRLGVNQPEPVKECDKKLGPQPKNIPLECRRRKDDEGSRPGTPLCDEVTPEEFLPDPRSVRERTCPRPMCLPVPKWYDLLPSFRYEPPRAGKSPRSLTPKRDCLFPRSPVPADEECDSDASSTPLFDRTLEEKLKQLDLLYEKWCSRTSGDCLLVSADASVKFCEKPRVIDLEQLKDHPSDIVQCLLHKRGVFDADFERLERVSEKYEPKPIQGNDYLSRLQQLACSHTFRAQLPVEVAQQPATQPEAVDTLESPPSTSDEKFDVKSEPTEKPPTSDVENLVDSDLSEHSASADLIRKEMKPEPEEMKPEPMEVDPPGLPETLSGEEEVMESHCSEPCDAVVVPELASIEKHSEPVVSSSPSLIPSEVTEMSLVSEASKQPELVVDTPPPSIDETERHSEQQILEVTQTAVEVSVMEVTQVQDLLLDVKPHLDTPIVTPLDKPCEIPDEPSPLVAEESKPELVSNSVTVRPTPSKEKKPVSTAKPDLASVGSFESTLLGLEGPSKSEQKPKVEPLKSKDDKRKDELSKSSRSLKDSKSRDSKDSNRDKGSSSVRTEVRDSRGESVKRKSTMDREDAKKQKLDEKSNDKSKEKDAKSGKSKSESSHSKDKHSSSKSKDSSRHHDKSKPDSSDKVKCSSDKAGDKPRFDSKSTESKPGSERSRHESGKSRSSSSKDKMRDERPKDRKSDKSSSSRKPESRGRDGTPKPDKGKSLPNPSPAAAVKLEKPEGAQESASSSFFPDLSSSDDDELSKTPARSVPSSPKSVSKPSLKVEYKPNKSSKKKRPTARLLDDSDEEPERVKSPSPVVKSNLTEPKKSKTPKESIKPSPKPEENKTKHSEDSKRSEKVKKKLDAKDVFSSDSEAGDLPPKPAEPKTKSTKPRDSEESKTPLSKTSSREDTTTSKLDRLETAQASKLGDPKEDKKTEKKLDIRRAFSSDESDDDSQRSSVSSRQPAMSSSQRPRLFSSSEDESGPPPQANGSEPPKSEKTASDPSVKQGDKTKVESKPKSGKQSGDRDSEEKPEKPVHEKSPTSSVVTRYESIYSSDDEPVGKPKSPPKELHRIVNRAFSSEDEAALTETPRKKKMSKPNPSLILEALTSDDETPTKTAEKSKTKKIKSSKADSQSREKPIYSSDEELEDVKPKSKRPSKKAELKPKKETPSDDESKRKSSKQTLSSEAELKVEDISGDELKRKSAKIPKVKQEVKVEEISGDESRRKSSKSKSKHEIKREDCAADELRRKSPELNLGMSSDDDLRLKPSKGPRSKPELKPMDPESDDARRNASKMSRSKPDLLKDLSEDERRRKTPKGPRSKPELKLLESSDDDLSRKMSKDSKPKPAFKTVSHAETKEKVSRIAARAIYSSDDERPVQRFGLFSPDDDRKISDFRSENSKAKKQKSQRFCTTDEDSGRERKNPPKTHRSKSPRARSLSDSESGSDSDLPEKNIFIVEEEPIYISMYDKVKARSCKRVPNAATPVPASEKKKSRKSSGYDSERARSAMSSSDEVDRRERKEKKSRLEFEQLSDAESSVSNKSKSRSDHPKKPKEKKPSKSSDHFELEQKKSQIPELDSDDDDDDSVKTSNKPKKQPDLETRLEKSTESMFSPEVRHPSPVKIEPLDVFSPLSDDSDHEIRQKPKPRSRPSLPIQTKVEPEEDPFDALLRTAKTQVHSPMSSPKIFKHEERENIPEKKKKKKERRESFEILSESNKNNGFVLPEQTKLKSPSCERFMEEKLLSPKSVKSEIVDLDECPRTPTMPELELVSDESRSDKSKSHKKKKKDKRSREERKMAKKHKKSRSKSPAAHRIPSPSHPEQEALSIEPDAVLTEPDAIVKEPEVIVTDSEAPLTPKEEFPAVPAFVTPEPPRGTSSPTPHDSSFEEIRPTSSMSQNSFGKGPRPVVVSQKTEDAVAGLLEETFDFGGYSMKTDDEITLASIRAEEDRSLLYEAQKALQSLAEENQPSPLLEQALAGLADEETYEGKQEATEQDAEDKGSGNPFPNWQQMNQLDEKTGSRFSLFSPIPDDSQTDSPKWASTFTVAPPSVPPPTPKEKGDEEKKETSWDLSSIMRRAMNPPSETQRKPVITTPTREDSNMKHPAFDTIPTRPARQRRGRKSIQEDGEEVPEPAGSGRGRGGRRKSSNRSQEAEAGAQRSEGQLEPAHQSAPEQDHQKTSIDNVIEGVARGPEQPPRAVPISVPISVLSPGSAKPQYQPQPEHQMQYPATNQKPFEYNIDLPIPGGMPSQPHQQPTSQPHPIRMSPKLMSPPPTHALTPMQAHGQIQQMFTPITPVSTCQPPTDLKSGGNVEEKTVKEERLDPITTMTTPTRPSGVIRSGSKLEQIANRLRPTEDRNTSPAHLIPVAKVELPPGLQQSIEQQRTEQMLTVKPERPSPSGGQSVSPQQRPGQAIITHGSHPLLSSPTKAPAPAYAIPQHQVQHIQRELLGSPEGIRNQSPIHARSGHMHPEQNFPGHHQPMSQVHQMHHQSQGPQMPPQGYPPQNHPGPHGQVPVSHSQQQTGHHQIAVGHFQQGALGNRQGPPGHGQTMPGRGQGVPSHQQIATSHGSAVTGHGQVPAIQSQAPLSNGPIGGSQHQGSAPHHNNAHLGPRPIQQMSLPRHPQMQVQNQSQVRQQAPPQRFAAQNLQHAHSQVAPPHYQQALHPSTSQPGGNPKQAHGQTVHQQFQTTPGPVPQRAPVHSNPGHLSGPGQHLVMDQQQNGPRPVGPSQAPGPRGPIQKIEQAFVHRDQPPYGMRMTVGHQEIHGMQPFARTPMPAHQSTGQPSQAVSAHQPRPVTPAHQASKQTLFLSGDAPVGISPPLAHGGSTALTPPVPKQLQQIRDQASGSPLAFRNTQLDGREEVLTPRVMTPGLGTAFDSAALHGSRRGSARTSLQGYREDPRVPPPAHQHGVKPEVGRTTSTARPGADPFILYQHFLRAQQQPGGRSGFPSNDERNADSPILYRSPPPAPAPVARAPAIQTPPQASQVPPQADSLLTLLNQRYPVMWQGLVALKNDQAAVQMHFISGNASVARGSLPRQPDGSTLPLRISQRMRLEQTQLEGVARKMQMEAEHCILLALPCGRDHMDVLQQSNNLKTGFITYLQSKQAAGIVNIAGPGSQQAAFVVHVFPSCEFGNENLSRIAPDLLHRISELAHLLVIIATV